MNDYEAHITLLDDRSLVRQAVETIGNGWTFSCIDGDPVLGDKVHCYATNHFDDASLAKLLTRDMAVTMSRWGVRVIRMKVEQIIWDVRV